VSISRAGSVTGLVMDWFEPQPAASTAGAQTAAVRSPKVARR
jgi:hypothetical protein